MHYWDPSIAPSGMAFYTGDRYPAWKGNLFVGALVQKHLARARARRMARWWRKSACIDGRARIRDVRQGPDGYLYMLTDEAAPMGRVMRVTP